MKALLYLLQVSACTALFYAFYFLLLRRVTFFGLNRYYLLFTLVLSFAIPAMTLPLRPSAQTDIDFFLESEAQVQATQTLPDRAVLDGVGQSNVARQPLEWYPIAVSVYLVIVVLSLLHLAFTLWGFYRCSRKGEVLQRVGRAKIVKSQGKMGNSSFFNVIFIHEDKLAENERAQVIDHELWHVRLMHSLDRILARVALIFLWFNPIAYFYAWSIAENHEFEVDRLTAERVGKSSYVDLLLKLAAPKGGVLLHSFSKVPLKGRITMLFHQPSPNRERLCYLLTLPLLAIACWAFSRAQEHSNEAILARAHYLYSHVKDTTRRDNVYTEEMLLAIGQNSSVYTSLSKIYQHESVHQQKEEQTRTWTGPGLPYFKLNVGRYTTSSSIFRFSGIKKMILTENLINDYLYEDGFPEIGWVIATDTLTVQGISCQKATAHFKGRNWIAWFAPELPFQTGPWKLGGLPGLIVEARDEKAEIAFKLVEFKAPDEAQRQKTQEFKKRKYYEYDVQDYTRLDTIGLPREKDPISGRRLFVRATSKEVERLKQARGKNQKAFIMAQMEAAGYMVRDQPALFSQSNQPVQNNPIELPFK